MRLFKIPILIAVVLAVALVGALGRFAFRSVYDSGYQRGADSVAVAADLAKTAAVAHVKDSLLAANVALTARSNDTARALALSVDSINRRVTKLRRTAVPTVALAPAVDSQSRAPSVAIRIDDDTAEYRVHVNVERWIQLANATLAQDDSIIGAQNYVINVRYPTLVAMRDGQLKIMEQATVAYDSIVATQRSSIERLNRRIAELTPGTVDRVERYALYALAAYGAYQGARRLAGS